VRMCKVQLISCVCFSAGVATLSMTVAYHYDGSRMLRFSPLLLVLSHFGPIPSWLLLTILTCLVRTFTNSRKSIYSLLKSLPRDYPEEKKLFDFSVSAVNACYGIFGYR
jgi:hypothetical protein